MPSAYGDRMTTFEDSEKESEYGYVRKVWTRSPRLFSLFFGSFLLIDFVFPFFVAFAEFAIFGRLISW